METYPTTEIIRILKNQEISLFSLTDFGRLFNLKKRQTLYKKLARLEKQQIIKRLIKGKYLFTLNQPSHYQIANYLCQPSYITLDSALSFYGITTGFSYQITSFTPKKTRTYIVNQQEYSFRHVTPKLFWGYQKQEKILMATPEKAVLDYLYFSSKGLRLFDQEEFDFKSLKKQQLINMAQRLGHAKILAVIKKI